MTGGLDGALVLGVNPSKAFDLPYKLYISIVNDYATQGIRAARSYEHDNRVHKLNILACE